jgi:hypothetical protein
MSGKSLTTQNIAFKGGAFADFKEERREEKRREEKRREERIPM